ncbi:hypothetical protein [Geobacter sp. AOG2]|uniref:hypothetical protein n=1 Tax=Geobacter sp. AOG2 TaxID=1566347 RepID=UPI001CC5FF60|nr:hypothetical protein [Geobacter sp. AOG2]
MDKKYMEIPIGSNGEGVLGGNEVVFLDLAKKGTSGVRSQQQPLPITDYSFCFLGIWSIAWNTRL